MRWGKTRHHDGSWSVRLILVTDEERTKLAELMGGQQYGDQAIVDGPVLSKDGNKWMQPQWLVGDVEAASPDRIYGRRINLGYSDSCPSTSKAEARKM